MRNLIILILIITTLLSCKSSTKKQENKVAQLQGIYATEVINNKKESIGLPDTLKFVINGNDFIICPYGQLYWGVSKSDSLKLNVDMGICKAFFISKDSLLYLFCEETNSDDGASEIFNINTNNKKLEWKASLSGFNLGKPVLKGDYAYLTAIGMVAKLDLKTGKYVYEYDNLYTNSESAFNSFDSVVFRGDQTIFISKNYLTNKKDSVIVNEETKSIEIKK
jgi:outer membrane protein assembly factor BamB